MELRFIDNKDRLFSEVKTLWRKNSSTLGFFPDEAFLDHAKKKWIIVVEDNGKLSGYLLFRITSSTSRISITHLCVSDEYKRKGLSTQLLNTLVDKYKDTSLRGICLYCREDYKDAPKLWEKYGFKPRDEKKGKNLDGHQLIFWWFDFGKPDLFTGIIDTSKIRVAIDANIIIHLRDSLSEHNQEAYLLLSDWVINDVEYYYAPEIFIEINRDEDSSRRQLTRNYLKRFKEITVDATLCNEAFKIVSKIIPSSSVNDTSDQKQLSEAICSGFEYFITRDNNLLNHSYEILEACGITILRPSEFILELDEIYNTTSYQPVRLAGVNYNINKVSRSDVSDLTISFLFGREQESKKDFEDRVINLTGNVKDSEIKVVKDNDNKVALIAKTNCENGICEIPIIRIKKDMGGLKNTLFKQLISDKIKEAVKNNQQIVKISEKYLTSDSLAALQVLGFFKENEDWIKIALSGTVASKDLIKQYPFLENYSQLKTTFDILSQENVKNSSDKLNIERLLFPLKISDLNIPTYIIPIKPYWASHLFDTPSANQTLFGAIPELAWNRENVYYRSSRSNGLTFPARIIWYLSDQKSFLRRKHAVGISYLDNIEVDTAKSLFKKNFRYGIYKWRDIIKLAKNHYNKIMAIRFSDTQLFINPIPYNDLKTILFENNGKSYTFQSPVKIPQEIFLKLYKLGMNMDNQNNG